MAAPVLRPLHVGELLDVAIKIYSRNVLTFWKIVALIVLPVNVLGLIVTLSTVPDAFLDPDFGRTYQPFSSFEDEFWTFFAAEMLVVVLSIVMVTIATGAVMKAVSDVYLGGKPEAGSSLRFAARRVHSLVWLSILTFVIPILAAIALIIPGIWLWVAYTVAPAALLIEGRKGMKAVRRSFALVQGRWWQVFGATLIGFVLSGIVNGGLSALASPLVFADLEDNLILTLVVDTIVATIGGILTAPFQGALIAVIYFDLRVRKEGFDLQLLAQRIGTAPDPALRPDLLPPPPPSFPADGEQPPFWPPPPGWKPSGGSGS